MSDVDFDSLLGDQVPHIIAQYPQKRSAVMPLLHLVQQHQRHISGEAIKWIAAKLELEPINVWELVTFYPSYKEEPMGKLHFRVCKTLSCMMAGAKATGSALEETLGCKIGQTRNDGAVSIEWVECLACCDKAPVLMVNNDLHTHVDPAKAKELASSCNAS